MNEIPSMWRTELWHPLSVHFPIAFLILATVVGVGSLIFRKKETGPYLRFSLSLLLWVGIITFWWAYLTGLEAYGVVIREVCDPTVVKSHLYWAYISAWVFSAATISDVAGYFVPTKMQRYLSFFAVLLLIGGSAILLNVSHLGASLVYQQGAGVYRTSDNCAEFD